MKTYKLSDFSFMGYDLRKKSGWVDVLFRGLVDNVEIVVAVFLFTLYIDKFCL